MPCRRAWWLSAVLAVLVLAPPHAAHSDDSLLTSRRARLENMSVSDREELLRKQERFNDLPVEEQTRLRQLHSALSADPQAELLEQVMLGYHEWLKTLPSGQRAELLSLPRQERLEEIIRVVQQQERQRFVDLVARKLQPADHEVILEWFGDLVRQREEELVARLPEHIQQRMQQVNQHDRSRELMRGIRMHFWQDRSLIDNLQPQDEDIDRLAENLSEEARQTLGEVQDLDQRREVLRGWLTAALASRIPFQVDHDELKRFQEDLPPADKEYLENLPRDRMMSELRRMYMKKRFEEQRGRGPFRRGRPPEHMQRGPRPPN